MYQSFASFVNNSFTRIAEHRENIDFFNEALAIPDFPVLIVKHLERIENSSDGHDWWLDKELMKIFDDLYKCAIVSLPCEPVERIRWIALICIACSENAGFSYGNVLVPPDYLPDEEIEGYASLYGWDVIERIQELRKQLREKGWNSLVSDK